MLRLVAGGLLERRASSETRAASPSAIGAIKERTAPRGLGARVIDLNSTFGSPLCGHRERPRARSNRRATSSKMRIHVVTSRSNSSVARMGRARASTASRRTRLVRRGRRRARARAPAARAVLRLLASFTALKKLAPRSSPRSAKCVRRDDK